VRGGRLLVGYCVWMGSDLCLGIVCGEAVITGFVLCAVGGVN